MAWKLVECVAAPTAATERGRARASRFVRELEREISALAGDVVVVGRASDLSAISVVEFDAIRRRSGRVGIYCAWLRADGSEPSGGEARRPRKFFDACSPDAADVVVFIPFLADAAVLRSLVAQAAERFQSARITCLVGASNFGAERAAEELGRELGREVRARVVLRGSKSAAGRRYAALREAKATGADDGFPTFPPIVAVELLYDGVGRPKAA